MATAVAVVTRARRTGRARAFVAGAVVAVILGAAFCLSLAVGDFPVPVSKVVLTLFGRGDRATTFVVNELRLPRASTGVLVGIALGMSGAVFQSVTRNPLASPDIIGITPGASASAVFAILVLGLSGTSVAVAAVVGAIATALGIYVLAWRSGVSSYRLVLIGIAFAAMAVSLTSFLLTRAKVQMAQQAFVWITGSLNGRDWSQVRSLIVAGVVLVPTLLFLVRHLRVLQLGDDTAAALGVPVERARLGVILVAVALAAVATAAAGPIAFVAFVAPPIARWMSRSPGPSIVVSGLVGALVVNLADFAGQHLIGGGELPVGVVTGVVGAPYLMFLLARANKVGRGG